jgi:ectoine hydroxylase-related dioxygenase (phytanoyl-CoA dioxygenase family)
MTVTDLPLRIPTAEEIKTFHRDGAVLLKQVLPEKWGNLLAQGLEDARSNRAGASVDIDGPLSINHFTSNHSPALAKIIAESPVAELVGRVLNSSVRFYMDQMFYKPAGEIEPTPWHQDTCYYNVEGHDLVRAWISPDAVPRNLSMEVVRGSHLWNVTYHTWVGKPVTDDPKGAAKAALAIEQGRPIIDIEQYDSWGYLDSFRDHKLPSTPDISSLKDSFDIIGWDYQPGDVLLFHGHILHGADGGFQPDSPRRSHASMWAGNDMRYIHRFGQVIPDPKALYELKPQSGDLLSQFPKVFPKIWSPDSA